MAFLAFVHLALFLALSLSPGNSLVSSLCDHSMLASIYVSMRKSWRVGIQEEKNRASALRIAAGGLVIMRSEEWSDTIAAIRPLPLYPVLFQECVSTGGSASTAVVDSGHKPLGPACTRYDTRCYFNVRSKADTSQLDPGPILSVFVPGTNCALRIKKCAPRISGGIYFLSTS